MTGYTKLPLCEYKNIVKIYEQKKCLHMIIRAAELNHSPAVMVVQSQGYIISPTEKFVTLYNLLILHIQMFYLSSATADFNKTLQTDNYLKHD